MQKVIELSYYRPSGVSQKVVLVVGEELSRFQVADRGNKIHDIGDALVYC